MDSRNFFLSKGIMAKHPSSRKNLLKLANQVDPEHFPIYLANYTSYNIVTTYFIFCYMSQLSNEVCYTSVCIIICELLIKNHV